MIKNKKNIWIFLSLITIAALTRLMPHPPNFTAIGSIALFGGMVAKSKYLKYLLPIGALFISDIVISLFAGTAFLHNTVLWVYASFLLIVLLGSFMKKITIGNVLGASVLSATLFFLVTNFGEWASGLMYPMTLNGLTACYAAAIPFFANSLISTVLFSAILFGGYSFVDSKGHIKAEVRA